MIAAIRHLLDAVYPPRCGLCGFLDPRAICATCEAEFEPATESKTYEGLDATFALYRYTGRAAQAVKRLKFSRVTSLAEPMAGFVACAANELPEFDLVVPVPIHWSRRCLRGFNQSELLARHIADGIYEPELLKRRVATRPQARLSPDERESNLRGAFKVSRKVAGERILLVDDVVTSGCTARECAMALRGAGASRVMLVTFASGSA